MVAKLNRYLTIMQKVIYDHGGNVDKFNGDGLMAFWGVPHSSVYDESNAGADGDSYATEALAF